MAAAAACRRVGQWGSSSFGIALARSRGSTAVKVPCLLETSIFDPFSASISRCRQIECRHISQLENSKVRKLEGQGVPSEQAEGHHFSLLLHEIEKLRNEIAKTHSELRHMIAARNRTLEAQLEETKYDMIKYCIGTFVLLISAAGIAVQLKNRE